MAVRVLVTGAGGFIGSHLVNYLKRKGYWIRATDIKYPQYQQTFEDEFAIGDLKNPKFANFVTQDIEEVYALAANMGGMGFISSNNSLILHENSLINLNTIEASRKNGVDRYFYSSSACIYPEYKQTEANLDPLKEEDAYPAQPQDAYGWEKLVTEKLCQYYMEDYGLQTRVARFHNIYGPHGTYKGGREKAPAALCRKIADAKLNGLDYIEIWGDGEQTRSFCYIADCLEGIYKLTHSDHLQPLNIGSDRMVTINELADIIMNIADVELEKRHITGPQGVRGRNSDNTKLKEVLNWEPQISLEQGLQTTYNWIEKQVYNG